MTSVWFTVRYGFVCSYVTATVKFCNQLLEDVEATAASRGRDTGAAAAANSGSK